MRDVFIIRLLQFKVSTGFVGDYIREVWETMIHFSSYLVIEMWYGLLTEHWRVMKNRSFDGKETIN